MPTCVRCRAEARFSTDLAVGVAAGATTALLLNHLAQGALGPRYLPSKHTSQADDKPVSVPERVGVQDRWWMETHSISDFQVCASAVMYGIIREDALSVYHLVSMFSSEDMKIW